MSESAGELFVRIRPAPGSMTAFKQEASGPVAAAGRDLSKVFLAAFAIGGAAKTIESVVHAATSQQAAFAVLNQTVKNAGVSNELYGQSIETVLQKEARLKGFSEIDLASGFQRLVSVTHDTGRAFDDLQKAEDLARFRHIDLGTAALALSKVEQGSATALQRTGIIVPKVTAAVDALTARREQAVIAGAKFSESDKVLYNQALAVAQAQDKQATRTEALTLIQERAGGSAKAFANTAAGQFARLAESFHQFEAEVGTKVIPVLTKAISLGTEFAAEIGIAVGAFATYKIAGAFVGRFASVAAAEVAGEAGSMAELTAALVANTTALQGNNVVAAEAVTIYGPLGGELSTVAIAEAAVGTAAAAATPEVAGLAGAATGLSGALAGIAALGAGALATGLFDIVAVLASSGSGTNTRTVKPGAQKAIADLLQSGQISTSEFHKAIKEAGSHAKTTGNALNDPKVLKILSDFAIKNGLGNQADIEPGIAPKGLVGAIGKALTPAQKIAADAGKAARAALLKSLTEGISSDKATISGLQQSMADIVTQGAQALQDAVAQAKQNLASIGAGLAQSIAQFIDKPLADAAARIAHSQSQIGLENDQTSLKRLGQSVVLPGGVRLSNDPARAVAQLEKLQRTTKSPALDDFVRQFKSAALTVASDKVGLQQQSGQIASQAVTTRIADLTDLAGSGAISKTQLDAQITLILRKFGITAATARKRGGVAFADTLSGQVSGLDTQATALADFPGGSGLIPSITRPLDTLTSTNKQIASNAREQRNAQISEQKKTNELLKKVHSSQVTKAYDNSLTHNPGHGTKTTQALTGTSR